MDLDEDTGSSSIQEGYPPEEQQTLPSEDEDSLAEERDFEEPEDVVETGHGYNDLRPYFSEVEWFQLTEAELQQFKQQKSDYEYLLLNGEKQLEYPQFVSDYLEAKYGYEFMDADSQRVFCTLCVKPMLRTAFHKHLRNLHIIARRTAQCRDCKRTFKDMSALQRHVDRVHRGGRLFYCPLCYAEFKTDAEREMHRLSSTMQDSYECPQCTEFFPAQCLLDKHSLWHTNIDLPFACTKCDAAFDRLSRLLEHEAIHASVRPFSCSLCNACFKLPRYVQSHYERCHSTVKRPEFKCCVCEKSYVSKHALQIHLGRRPFVCVTSYPCDFCRIEFRTPPLLQQHMLAAHVPSGVGNGTARKLLN